MGGRAVVVWRLVGTGLAIEALAAESGIEVHFDGKTEVQAGRKMGHVNRVG
ncbi:hypothetical protein [Pseudooceanicola sp. MF1-13]|uniref:hypothetical protein n=1 Tax=Pseudooceanicola sp. MF1-13 TaxID=3379095 RepID=UPI003891FF4A